MTTGKMEAIIVEMSFMETLLFIWIYAYVYLTMR